MELFSEETIIDTLIIGSIVAGFLGLLIAGHWQEIRMIGKEETQQAEAQHGANNYGRLQARLSDSSEVIRKGHE